MYNMFRPDPENLRDVMGPLVEFTTGISSDEGFCLLRSVVPSGVQVGVHSHPDRETLFILDGELEGLIGESWGKYGSGATIDVPGGLPHAFRNSSGKDVLLLLVSTMQMGRFFKEIAEPFEPAKSGPPSIERMNHFVETALRYGYWLANVEENKALGLSF